MRIVWNNFVRKKVHYRRNVYCSLGWKCDNVTIKPSWKCVGTAMKRSLCGNICYHVPITEYFFPVHSQHISWQLTIFYAFGDLSDPILDGSSFYLCRSYTTGGTKRLWKYFHSHHPPSSEIPLGCLPSSPVIHPCICTLLCTCSYTKRPLDFASSSSSSSVFSSHSIC
jgi:hypothetical protein